MKPAPHQQPPDEFLKTSEIAFWILILVLTSLALLLPLLPGERVALIAATASGAAIYWLYSTWLGRRYEAYHWLNWLNLITTTFLVSAITYLLEPHNIHIEVLYIPIIASAGVQAGRRAAWLATLLAAVGFTASELLHNFPNINHASLGTHLVMIVAGGFFTGQLTALLQARLDLLSKRNRYLSLITQAQLVAAAPDDFDQALYCLAEIIQTHLPAQECHFLILSKNALPDEEDRRQNDRASLSVLHLPAAVLQEMTSWLSESEPNTPLKLTSNQIETFRQLLNPPPLAAEAQSGDGEYWLVPLQTGEAVLGALLLKIGVSSSWDMDDPELRGIIQTLASQIAAALNNRQLLHSLQDQAQRLAVLNEVGKAINSTIELPQLLELIYQQLGRIIPTDTYFVGLYDEAEGMVDLRIFIDDGERFPPTRNPLGRGFASYVLEAKAPLLVRHLSREMDTLPVKPIVLGKNRMSESWLGVPLMIGDHVLGLIAVASYSANAFDEEDVSLLVSLASQAALALDNANQHDRVKEQARRDSLTGAYNHGYLVQRLGEEVAASRQSGLPVSLIMLDIDFFKEYNDQYGHVVGDEVLRQIVIAIQTHIKKTDIVGRWGGEEFAIVLLNSLPEVALQVANRVRHTLAGLRLRDPRGQLIPSPTVSQGIACFPLNASDAFELVDVADQALYVAKHKGRDQVEIASVPPSAAGQSAAPAVE